jgi:predicted RNase H-like HicB family nuclease
MKNFFDQFQIRLEKDGDQYHAFAAALSGCHTFGATPQNALENLQEAILVYLEDVVALPA